MSLGTKDPAVRNSSLSKEQDFSSCGFLSGRSLTVLLGPGGVEQGSLAGLDGWEGFGNERNSQTELFCLSQL